MASSPISKTLLSNGATENNNLLLKSVSRPTIHDFAALQAALSATSTATNLGKISNPTNLASPVGASVPAKPDVPISIPAPIVTSQLHMTKQAAQLALSPIAPTITPLGCLPTQSPQMSQVANLAAAAAARTALGQLLKSQQLMGAAHSTTGGTSPIGLGPRPGSGGDGLGSIPPVSSGISGGGSGVGCQLHLSRGTPCFCSSCALQKSSMHNTLSTLSQSSLAPQQPPIVSSFSSPSALPPPLGPHPGAPPPPTAGLLPLPLVPNPAAAAAAAAGMLPLPGAAGLLPPVMSAGIYGPPPHSPFFDGGLHPSAADWVALGRRKNATRETTAALKSWLQEHLKNPYPTKGEKVMLAIITKMSLTQVSTWFANARRRLKKEGKMTWTPRNSYDDDDDDDMDDDDDVTALDENRSLGSKTSRQDETPSGAPPKTSDVLRVSVNEDDEGYNDDLFTPKDSSACNNTSSGLSLSGVAGGGGGGGNPVVATAASTYQGLSLLKCKVPPAPFANPITANKITLVPNNCNPNSPFNSPNQTQVALPSSVTTPSSTIDLFSDVMNSGSLSTHSPNPSLSLLSQTHKARRRASNGSKFWSIVDTAAKGEEPISPQADKSPLDLSPQNSDNEATSPKPLTIAVTCSE